MVNGSWGHNGADGGITWPDIAIQKGVNWHSSVKNAFLFMKFGQVASSIDQRPNFAEYEQIVV
jgi:hypothetical protein